MFDTEGLSTELIDDWHLQDAAWAGRHLRSSYGDRKALRRNRCTRTTLEEIR